MAKKKVDIEEDRKEEGEVLEAPAPKTDAFGNPIIER